jgi:E3 ubiquitin-protein ligase RFWD2
MSAPRVTTSTSASTSRVDDALRAHVVCPICLDTFADAHCVATCGHTFCHGCASAALDASATAEDDAMDVGERRAKCPTCSSSFTRAQLVPNAAVNAMVAEMKRARETETRAAADKDAAAHGEDALRHLTPLVKSLSAKHRDLVIESRAVSQEVLREFLLESRSRKQASADALDRELRYLDADIAAVRRELEVLGGEARADEPVSERNDKEVIAQAMDTLGLARNGDPSMDATKRRRVLTQFNELQRWYSKRRYTEQVDANNASVNGDGVIAPGRTTMEEFSSLINTFKRYSKLSIAAELNTDADATGSNVPISSIEFDCAREHFATAGVSKRIQLYNLESVLRGSHDTGTEIATRSKLTCLSYNKFTQQHIAASDYEGIVSVWDVEKQRTIIDFEEHEKRIWTVDYSRVDSKMLVSGSDDYLVKIWSTDQANSVHEIDMKANVCCVQYSPESSHCVAVGCVDHQVYLFDLRRLAEPVQTLCGHRKAVSYVKYLNANEIASASTDNSVKVWDAKTGELTCELKGHHNERNFVGLSTVGDYIACGSETNEVYVYRKDLASPITSVRFARDLTEPHGFISACTWRDDDLLIAANSNGVVKILRS